MNRFNSTFKAKQSSLKRTAWIKKQRSESTARKARRVYLKAKPDSAAQKRFKREVRERDNFTCQFPGCGYYDLSIDVHHIAKRSQRPDLKLDPKNALCLCRFHHAWTDYNRTEAIALGLLADENNTFERARKIA